MDDLYDVIVIGGGPAGLTAQLYAIQKGLKSLLISQDLGGENQFSPLLTLDFKSWSSRARCATGYRTGRRDSQ